MARSDCYHMIALLHGGSPNRHNLHCTVGQLLVELEMEAAVFSSNIRACCSIVHKIFILMFMDKPCKGMFILHRLHFEGALMHLLELHDLSESLLAGKAPC